MAVYGNVENIDAIVLANVEAGARHIDGFSPIVETEQTATGEHITITDKEAVHEFDIRNGSAMAARVEGETAYFVSDGAQYQPVEISDENDYFDSDTVEGALDELYEASADIASDVADLQDALETEQTAIRTVALGGTGADNAEDAIENLGIADYVLERGTSGIWDYAKWNSGRITLELRKVSLNPTAVTEIGNLFCYYWRVIPPQELLISSPDNGHYSFKASTGYDAGGGIQLQQSAITMYGMSTATVTTSSTIITNLTVEGRWK